MRWSWIVEVAVVGGLLLTSLPAARACPWPEEPDDAWSAVVVERTTDGWVWYRVDPAGDGVPFRLYGRWGPESSVAADLTDGVTSYQTDGRVIRQYVWMPWSRAREPDRTPAVVATLCGLALAAVIAILRWRRRTVAVVP